MSSQSSQSSQNAMKQLNIPFSASKASAAAHKAKETVPTPTPSPPTSTPAEASLPTVVDAQTADKKPDAKGDATPSAATSPASEEEKHEEREETIEKGVIRASKAKENDQETLSQPEVQDGTPVVAKEVKEESGAKDGAEAVVGNEVVEEAAVDAQEDQIPVDPIEARLRVFDLTPKYGPYIGMTRLQRWQRAKELELDPPVEVYDALVSEEGVEDLRYAQNVFEGRV